MNGPLLTVVIPIYNAEKYIKDVVTCVLNQTYKSIELILVDDGSIDKSAEICDEYHSKYSFIKVIHKVNGGVHTARNTGLEAATGEYICFIDSDDWINEDYCELLMSAIIETKSDFAACGFITEYAKKKVSTKKIKDHPDTIIFSTPNACTLAIGNRNHSVGGFVWNKIFRVSTIANLRFRDDIPICDDLFFTYEFANKSKCGCLVDAPLYHYRYVADGLSKNSPIQRYINCLRGMKKLCAWVENNASHCTNNIYKNYIFWNTKSCEHMINNYNESAYLEIKENLNSCKKYIPICSKRIKILSLCILHSWKRYRFWGLNVWRLKQLYIKLRQL